MEDLVENKKTHKEEEAEEGEEVARLNLPSLMVQDLYRKLSVIKDLILDSYFHHTNVEGQVKGFYGDLSIDIGIFENSRKNLIKNCMNIQEKNIIQNWFIDHILKIRDSEKIIKKFLNDNEIENRLDLLSITTKQTACITHSKQKLIEKEVEHHLLIKTA